MISVFELICKKFCVEREHYNHYMAHPEEVEKILTLGAGKAAAVANSVLARVRKKLGY